MSKKSSTKTKMMNDWRAPEWRPWDALHKALAKHKSRYVKKAAALAQKFLGRKFYEDPAKRMASIEYLLPRLEVMLEIARLPLGNKKGGKSRGRKVARSRSEGTR